MRELGKYLILLISIVATMFVASLIVAPVSMFGLPTDLAQNIDIRSYFFQGLCSSLVGVVGSYYLKLSRHAVFSLCVLWGVVISIVQSLRVGEPNLYFIVHSVLPFLVGVATLIYFVGYAQHLTSLPKGRS